MHLSHPNVPNTPMQMTSCMDSKLPKLVRCKTLWSGSLFRGDLRTVCAPISGVLAHTPETLRAAHSIPRLLVTDVPRLEPLRSLARLITGDKPNGSDSTVSGTHGLSLFPSLQDHPSSLSDMRVTASAQTREQTRKWVLTVLGSCLTARASS